MVGEKGKREPWPLLALGLAWVIPGAGHAYVGRPGRGIVLFITIAALFWTGVGIGGAFTVDHQRQRWWFYAEMLTGVHGLAGWYNHQVAFERIKPEVDRRFHDPQAYGQVLDAGSTQAQKAHLYQNILDEVMAEKNLALVAPTDSVARAYAGVAGMLNVLAMFDAMLLAMMNPLAQAQAKPVRAKGDKRR